MEECLECSVAVNLLSFGNKTVQCYNFTIYLQIYSLFQKSCKKYIYRAL